MCETGPDSEQLVESEKGGIYLLVLYTSEYWALEEEVWSENITQLNSEQYFDSQHIDYQSVDYQCSGKHERPVRSK